MPLQDGAATLTQRARVETVALSMQKLLGKISSAFCGVGLSVLLGFDPPPSMRVFQELLHDNMITATVILSLVLVIGVGSFIITWRKKSNRKPVKNPLMRLARTLGESLVEIIIGVVAGLLLGIGSAPSTIPILTLIRTHPPIAIAIGLALLVILILAPLISSDDAREDVENTGGEEPYTSPSGRLWFASATSLVSLLLLFSLFGLITIRPSWCPTSICPAPQLVVVTNRNGVNDGVMESYYLAQQSDDFAMTQDPTTYTFSNLPVSVGAIELGKSPTPYNAIIGIHSLQRNTRYGLIIDGVDLVIDKVTPITGPVDVFIQGANLTYATRIYTIAYIGEPTGSKLPTNPPKLVIGLEVGGSDELSVRITSATEVSLQFHLQVRYHQIVGGALVRTLVIPHEFAVDFVAPAHWKPYIFSGGKMIPQP